ncbi:MAG TPA: 23S rRNA (adenine(2503)-C(2))-methyltransferase RlmN [Vicinamibacteria bacterium]|nr:23S rRNA (adenine(2503)-C(2))-methyltransferase RlmN [Vicinamibacteria bacterium]
MEPRPNLFGMSRPALARLAGELGEPAYRAAQLYSWLYRRRARSLVEMTDLPRPLRERLAAGHGLRWPEVVERSRSADGTVKYLFRLDDGATIESVYIPEERRRTICISTQAGCPLKCAFCLTGIAGYKRNLKPWEILGQVAEVMAEEPPEQKAWNIVVMGMGEPLLNYDATVHALRILMDPEGFAVAPKKLTLSTVGILPALEKLMEEPVRPNLAISLHAPNARLRGELMPIEEKYRLEDVIAAAQRYPIPRGGMVTYEYVLLGGVNDSPGHARELVRLLRGSRAKVNLIPLNPAPDIPFQPPTRQAVDEFAGILAAAHVTVSVRRQRGQDILAACGQLHLKTAAAGVSVDALR